MANSAYFVKLTPRAFSVSFFIHCKYVADILKMCMKKAINDDKIFFDKFTAFLNLNMAIFGLFHI